MVTDSYTFNQLIKQYQKDAQGVSQWEKYLTGLSETYEQGEQAIQEKTSYDISGAYANYKKSQLNLLHNQRLGTGLKEQLSGDLQSSYASSYGELKSTEAEQLQKLQSSITSAYTSAEKQVAQSAEQLSKITDYLYEFGNIDTSLLEKSREAGGLGYFETSKEGTKLTGYGKAGLGGLLYQEQNGQYFSDYLYEVDRDLYDWYMNNLDLARGTIAGFEPGTTSFTKEEQSTMIAAEEAEKEFKKLYPELYDESKTFDSEKERLDYYNKQQSNVYAEERKEAFKNYTSEYNFSDMYKEIGTNNPKSLENKIQKDLSTLLGINDINVKTNIVGNTTYQGERVNSYTTTITIDKSNLTSSQIELLNGLKTTTKNNSYVIKLNLGRTDKITNELNKQLNGYTYEEFFKLLSK